MSIPLDRLYHYLRSQINEDIIIYRWFPHGSKKIDDLGPIDSKFFIGSDLTPNITEFQRHLLPIMICHDQEPLNYNYYTEDDCVSTIEHMLDIRKVSSTGRVRHFTKNFLNACIKSRFRIMVSPRTNLHDNMILCHSEKNSIELEKYEQNGFIGAYYWSHALVARDWFRFAEHDSELTPDFNNVRFDFLIYNRAWSGSREYRLKFIELVVNHQLVEHCHTKFNPVDDDCCYTDHKFANSNLSIKRADLETFFNLNSTSSCASADYEPVDYSHSGIEVVLETLFDDTRLHLTEKALRPIACGRPFIIAATPGSLAYLRSYGFKTFDGLIDETYDTITDPVTRLEAITNEMRRIASLDQESKQELFAKLYKIADYNKRHFFSQTFHELVLDEFVKNTHRALEISRSKMTGKWWKFFVWPEEMPDDNFDNSKILGFDQVEQWLQEHNRLID